MSLLDNMRQTITDVAGSVVEQSKQLTTQAQLQLQIKKLQMERAKRIHELGKQTFTWYQGGNLSVSGPVPLDITDLCRQLEDIETQLTENERQLEIAQQTDVVNATATTTVSVSTPDPDPNAAPTGHYPPPPVGQYAPPPGGYPPPPPPTYAPPPNPMPYPPHNPHATTVLPDYGAQGGPMNPPSQNPINQPPHTQPHNPNQPNTPPNNWPGQPPKS